MDSQPAMPHTTRTKYSYTQQHYVGASNPQTNFSNNLGKHGSKTNMTYTHQTNLAIMNHKPKYVSFHDKLGEQKGSEIRE